MAPRCCACGGSVTLEQHRRHGAFRLFDKGHAVLRAQVNANEVAEFDLAGSHQIGQGEHDVPLDRTLQVARAVFGIRALLQQKAFRFRSAVEHELVCARRHQDALLHHPQLDLEDLLQVLRTQGLEHHDLVNAVHELRRELPARRFYRGAINLFVEGCIHLFWFLRKAQTTVGEGAHLPCPQVRGHDDDALREINASVITQRERCLVQNSEQQLPQRIGGFLDLVEEQNRELQLVRVPLVERFLGQQRVRLPVSQVARRRTNQFGDFMGVLEFRAIDFDAGACVAKHRFCHRLHDPGLPGASGSEEQEVSYRAPRRVQARQKHLVDLRHFLDGLVLTDDFAAHGTFKVSGIVAATGRVEHCGEVGFHRVFGPCLSWAFLPLPGSACRCLRNRVTNSVTRFRPLSCKRLAILI